MGGRTQGGEPMLNSECGNVWGYEGSTGDVDWSFDYHAMMDEFRRHPKVAGWLYTEHHDVVNEWNGYVRADRSEKETGIGELVPGMTLRDWHAPFYVAVGSYPTTAAKPGETVSVPLWASFLTDASPGPRADAEARARRPRRPRPLPRVVEGRAQGAVRAVDVAGARRRSRSRCRTGGRSPSCGCALEDAAGRVLHRNFTAFVVGEGASPRDETVAAGRADAPRAAREPRRRRSAARWSVRGWDAMDGRKQNGAGAGFFEYRLAWPTGPAARRTWRGRRSWPSSGRRSSSARTGSTGGRVEGDFMRGSGTHDPGLNPNAYPMTDATRYPSAVRVLVNGVAGGPLRPARRPGRPPRARCPGTRRSGTGSSARPARTGTSSPATVPASALREAAAKGEVVIRLEVDEALPGRPRRLRRGRGTLPARPEPRADAAALRRGQGDGGGYFESRRRTARAVSASIRFLSIEPHPEPARHTALLVRRALQLEDAGCPRGPSGSRRWS